MRFGQVEKLLDTGPEPDAKPFAAAESDQRMRQLIALAERLRPRIEKTRDALQPVGRGPDQQEEAGDQQHDERSEQPPVHAAQEQDAHRDRRDHGEGAEIRLLQQQRADEQHHGQHRHEAAPQAAHERRLAHGVVGGVEHRAQFHQLGRLDAEPRHPQPALAAVDFAADARNEHDHQQRCAAHEQPRCQRLPQSQRHLERDRAGEQAQQQEATVAQQVVVGMEPGLPASLGDRDRGRVDHHQPESEQQHAGPEQGFVDGRDARRRTLQRGVEHASGCCNRATAARNASARWR